MKSSLGFVVGFACACSVALAANYDVLTNHNDNARSGLDQNETVLTPGNVNRLKILFQAPVDGQVYAQPLCVAKQLVFSKGVSKGKHDLVIVATEHGSVSAFDAETGESYWQVSLLSTGYTPVQASDPNIEMLRYRTGNQHYCDPGNRPFGGSEWTDFCHCHGDRWEAGLRL